MEGCRGGWREQQLQEGLPEHVTLCRDTGKSAFQTGRRGRSAGELAKHRAAWFSAASMEVRRGRPPRVALEKLGGSRKRPGEGVEEPAGGVAVRRLRTRSPAIAAGFPVCDEPG